MGFKTNGSANATMANGSSRHAEPARSACTAAAIASSCPATSKRVAWPTMASHAAIAYSLRLHVRLCVSASDGNRHAPCRHRGCDLAALAAHHAAALCWAKWPWRQTPEAVESSRTQCFNAPAQPGAAPPALTACSRARRSPATALRPRSCAWAGTARAPGFRTPRAAFLPEKPPWTAQGGRVSSCAQQHRCRARRAVYGCGAS